VLARRNQLVLLATLVLGAFYLTVFGDLCIVDDYSNIMEWSNAGAVTLKQIFLPGCSEGGYYRPLIGLSYLLNLRLWDLDSRMLHLENVLLHTANALLVYRLALALLPPDKRDNRLVPLAAGLLFGLHPICTESVDWISGRTDLIAGFFVLLAALFLVRYQRTGARPLMLGAGLCVLAGMMGKEVALGFLPGAFFLGRRGGPESSGGAAELPSYQETRWFLVLAGGTIVSELVFFNFWPILASAPLYGIVLYRLRRKKSGKGGPLAGSLGRLAGCLAAALLAAGIFFAVRSIVFASSIPRIPQTLKLMTQDPNHTISVFLGGTGFYVKKFLLPLPLNFAIREIDPLYSVLGTVIVFAGIFFAARRTLPRSLALTGVFLFAPALPLAFGTVAWTAYAERYIYISSAFWSIALVLWLAPRLPVPGRAAFAAGASLCLLAGAVTVQRNLVWQKSLTLMADTVQKSPLFREGRTIYMQELIKVGDLRGATEQYAVASSLPTVRYDDRLDAAMAEVLLKQKKDDEALLLYQEIYRKSRGSSVTAWRQIGHLLEAELAKVKEPGARDQLRLKLQRYRRPSSLSL
jgi:protein O-mannosyl-transferase